MLKKYKSVFNEGSSNKKTSVGGFFIDDKVIIFRKNNLDGEEGYISYIKIYSKNLGNTDELGISTKYGTIPQIMYDKGKFVELSNRKEIIIKKR